LNVEEAGTALGFAQFSSVEPDGVCEWGFYAASGASRGSGGKLGRGAPADAEEIHEAVDAARRGGRKELALLHCVSGYPAPAADYNLRTIPDMGARYGVVTGLSDHTVDNTTAIAGVALGAALIEKHFTVDRSGGGPDDSFSLEPPELAALCAGVRTVWDALGAVDYGLKSSEQGHIQFRRSLYFVKDLAAGDVITADAVRSVRPGFGLAPKYLSEVLGHKVVCAVTANTPVRREILRLE
jgi:N-acetylneuraminate synthase